MLPRTLQQATDIIGIELSKIKRIICGNEGERRATRALKPPGGRKRGRVEQKIYIMHALIPRYLLA
jgi:hypothetical protein